MDRIVYNPYKHHLAVIKEKIKEFAKQGENALQDLIVNLCQRGYEAGIVDVYEGKLSPEEIKNEVLNFLTQNNLLDAESYLNYLKEHGQIKRKGYYTTYTLSDGTILTLRGIEDGEEEYCHIHPGRYSPNTFRIRTNTLKTAIVTKFLMLCRNQQECNIDIINEARKYLGLSPVKDNVNAIFSAVEKLE